jgi:hypothetical protein
MIIERNYDTAGSLSQRLSGLWQRRLQPCGVVTASLAPGEILRSRLAERAPGVRQKAAGHRLCL